MATNLGSNGKGRYIYAIISGSEDRSFGSIGIFGEKVYTVSNARIAAVVSDFSMDTQTKIRPERRHLAAHQEVLKCIMKEATPLPMAFGIIADGPKAIQKILSANHKDFVEQLNRVAGKVEMGLRVTWDVPNIFEYFIQTHPELRQARDRYFGTLREPTQEDKIEVGRMFDRILNEDRDSHLERVEEILAPYCSELKNNPTRNEQEVLNLVCLVGRDAQKDFEAGVFQASNLFDNNFAFDYNGPWAPHNFVELDLKK